MASKQPCSFLQAVLVSIACNHCADHSVFVCSVIAASPLFLQAPRMVPTPSSSYSASQLGDFGSSDLATLTSSFAQQGVLERARETGLMTMQQVSA
jgi:hypothetical protein